MISEAKIFSFSTNGSPLRPFTHSDYYIDKAVGSVMINVHNVNIKAYVTHVCEVRKYYAQLLIF